MFEAPYLGDRKAQQQCFTVFGRGSLVLWTGGVTAFGVCKSTWPQNAKLGKNIDKFPLAPSKKGAIWTMQYVFVSGHVGSKKTVSAAYKFRCHYKQLRDLEFSTSQSIRVFRIFKRKKTRVRNIFDQR